MREKLLALAALVLLAAALSIHPVERGPRASTVSVYAVPVRLSSDAAPVAVIDVYPVSRYTGAGVRVAVVDTGVDYTHPDLAHAVEVLVSFTVKSRGRPLVFIVGVNGTLADARGLDELYRISTGSYAWLDENGHGTHVAGLIAGSGAASGGRYRGVAPGARLWVVKVLGRDGSGSLEDLLAALEWLADKPVDVVNLALGFRDESLARLVKTRVDALAARGKIVVAAAGNDGVIGAVNFPARLPSVYAVAAVDRDGRLAPFSSLGTPTDMKPDFAALGVAVVSTVPTYGSRVAPGRTTYAALSGTSMACAVASGLMALWVEAVGREAAPRAAAAAVLAGSPILPKTLSVGYGYLMPP
ncbi:MAG: S8 family serine peptidase [Thermofilaceae archaeon]